MAILAVAIYAVVGASARPGRVRRAARVRCWAVGAYHFYRSALMSQQSEDCEKKIQAMLAGDEWSDEFCRQFLTELAISDTTPVEAIAAMLRAAIKVRTQHEEN